MKIKPTPTDIEDHVISLKSIMCKTDVHGIIEYANEYFVKLSGYGEGEIMGESLNLIAHPDMPKVIYNYVWKKITSKQRVNAIVKYLSKSGNYYWMQIKLDFKVNEVTREISSIYLYAKSPERSSILELNKFYAKLNKIEKESDLKTADNYFIGFLENANLTYESFIDNYLKI